MLLLAAGCSQLQKAQELQGILAETLPGTVELPTERAAPADERGAVDAPQLSVVWTDPDFDLETIGLYYVRVFEIPTPRWSTHDVARNNLEVPDELPVSIH
jgi:hypothetical protein